MITAINLSIKMTARTINGNKSVSHNVFDQREREREREREHTLKLQSMDTVWSNFEMDKTHLNSELHFST